LYKYSAPLFGPIYRAPNLTAFWSETWHNAFTGPLIVIAYRPIRKFTGSRALGNIACFAIMGG
jgi:hypothetical protein